VPGLKQPASASPGRGHAVLVGAGILLSRVFGLIRQRALGHFLGLSDSSDAFNAAFRIPNFLQNLFGEGVLSASFIPVYARLRAQGRDADAERLARAVFSLLALVVAGIVLIGVLAAGPLTSVIAPGFDGEKRDLTIRMVRLLFPGAGFLALSAWCLGVLNSHRRFFLSYSAPVVWNLAIILALFWPRASPDAASAAVAAAVGSVVGSALQFLIQLPSAIGLIRSGVRPVASSADGLRTVVRNFGPAFVGRGVAQVSAFIDTLIGSLLGQGAVAGLASAQTIYFLPLSLFGMSISAAELPEFAADAGKGDEAARRIQARLVAGLRQMAFYVAPAAVALLACGGIITAALFETGRFTAEDSRYVWAILIGPAIGLLPATMARLYNSCFYALHDTRTPLKMSLIRVVTSTILGYLAALKLPAMLGVELRYGAVALTSVAGAAGWLEFLLLRSRLESRIGAARLPAGSLARLLLASFAGALAALGADWLIPVEQPVVRALVALLPFGLAYFAAARRLGLEEVDTLIRRFRPS
jgi:putative peptidoglycan lipid II flippase